MPVNSIEVKETLNIITHLEAFNLVLALKHLLPPDLHNYVILVNTDNQVSQQVLSSGSSKDLFLCTCARQLWLIAAVVHWTSGLSQGFS